MWPCSLCRPLTRNLRISSRLIPSRRCHRFVWSGASREQLLQLADEDKHARFADIPQLQPLLDEVRHLSSLEKECEEFETQLIDETDKEVQDLYRAEIASAQGRISAAANYLEELLLNVDDPDAEDELDSRDVVLELQPGVGGQEASFFAHELWQMYDRFTERHGLSFEVESYKEAEYGGLQEATAIIRGSTEGAFGIFRRESGVHRVQRIPVTDKKGRMQTSSAVVVCLPVADSKDIDIPTTDFRIEISKKSSGPGGQSVNAAHQAVRIVHLPTGMSVLSSCSQSQFDNKKRALELLKTRLFEKSRSEVLSKEKSDRKRQRGSGDRSEKVRTYNFQRGEVVDHRLEKHVGRCSVHGVVFEDQFDELIEQFKAQERAARIERTLQSLTERM